MSSEIQSYDPCGRAHAGEVSRRNDRQDNALPPPEWQGSSNEGRPYHGHWRRRMVPGGGFNSDSDSDNDDRRGALGGEDDTLLVRPRRNPLSTSSEAWNLNAQIPDPRAQFEQERLQIKHMQHLLEFLKEQVELAFAESDRALQEKHLLQLVPAGDQPDAVNSEIQLIMGQYVDNFMEAIVRVPPVILKRNQRQTYFSITPLAEKLVNNIYGKALPRCSLYVEVPDPVPACVTVLFPTMKAHQVFRVFIDDYKPFHAVPMTSSTLKPKGWRWTGSLSPNSQSEGSSVGMYWWHYQRGGTELTRNTVFRVRMNGLVEAVWNATDDDPEFAAYLKHAREVQRRALDEKRRKKEFLAAKRRIERVFGPMD